MNLSISSGPTTNPVGAAPFSVIAVLRNARITIGNNVGMSNCNLVARKSIVIEDDVLIGGGALIVDSDFHPLDERERLTGRTDSVRDAEVRIGRGAFVGARAIVLKGSWIGEGSVIAAGAVISGTVPPGELWAGNPARLVRHLNAGAAAENTPFRR